MARIDEPRLKADLKAGLLQRVYFLFGEERFLVSMYTNKIIDAALGKERSEMNFMKYSGSPKADELMDYTDCLPFFADYKVVLITDLEPDSLDADELKAYISIIENLPETTVLIISETGVEIDGKKPKAKEKKLMAAVEKAGSVCELSYLSPQMISAMAEKKAARAGCTLSRENGLYLAEMCGRSLSAVSNEMEKLCAYTGSGEITRAAIDALTPKQVDTSVYTLAAELLSGNTDKAFRILDDLFLQRIEPVVISAVLSGHFVDLYRAKLGQQAKKSYNDTAGAFRYPPNRHFLVKKAYSAVNRLSEEYLGACIDILYRTNKLLNSSKADRRVLLEQALTEISSLRR